MADPAGPRVRAAILAGGEATRLGGRKPTAELAGRSLIAYPVEAARAADLDPFVVAKPDSPLPPLDCEVIREPDRPIHPLRGILTAIETAGGRVLVLGCDMPFVTPALLGWLAQREPPAVAEVDGRLEPLLAVYGPSGAPALEAALEEEAPLRRAVERLDPDRVGEAELRRFGDLRRLVRSVNTEADLAEAARLIAG
jgi:molybdenum cofactor guanylyltransferase